MIPSRRQMASLVCALAFWTACETSLGLDAIGIVAVNVTPDAVTLIPGDTVRLSGIATDANGVGYAGGQPVWRTSDATVVSISPQGLATALDTGTVTISAEVSSVQGTSTITVEMGPTVVASPTALNFSANAGGANPAPQSVTISNGGAGTLDNVTVGAIAYGASQPTGWLTAELVTSAQLDLKVSIDGLGAGSYTATVTVGIAGSQDDTVSVTLVVS